MNTSTIESPLSQDDNFFSQDEKLLNNVHHVHLVHPPKISLDSAVDAANENTAEAIAVIESVLLVCGEEPEKLFKEAFLAAIKVIRKDVGLWAKYRVKLKRAKPSGVSLSDIDAATATPNDKANDSTASDLIDLVMESGELFFDGESDRSYFSGDIAGVDTTMAIDSKSFTDWLSFEYYSTTKAASNNRTGASASEMSIKQARFALCGIAKHEGGKQQVHMRIADINGGHYIAVCNDGLQVLEVTATGWRMLDKSPLKFWKPANAQSLPIPSAKGDYSKLWDYVNVIDHDRILILAWILECYRAATPNPVLLLTGGQGCAKSSSQNRLRELIDNNVVNLRSAPKAIEDIFVSSGCNWLVSFENMSNLTAQMQDALCVLATGGGFAARTLYTNAEETVIKAKRPVIINGISNVITAQDLTDRSVQIELQRVDYIEESIINANWAIDAPLIFGGILDLFVKTLEQLPKVNLDKPPRMADFTRLGEAMCVAMGKDAGYFTHIWVILHKGT